MYVIYDHATSHVLAEYSTFEQAEQCRVEFIGEHPKMADTIEVIDRETALARGCAGVAPVPHADNAGIAQHI